MANLKEVRNRIGSVQSTQQITKAMKMVSAAKLRRATDAIVQMRPYATKLRELLENLSSTMDGDAGTEYTVVRPVNKVLIVAITSNRGLCGAFNANVIREVNKFAKDKYAAQSKAGNMKVLCIGKKASDVFGKNKSLFAGHNNEVYADLTYVNVAAIAQNIMDTFAKGEYDRVEVIYNQFKNAGIQILTTEQLLPIEPPTTSGKKATNTDYIFEPSKEEIVTDLIPRSVKVQLFKAILDSHASEHGARMTAMNKATDNAAELLKALKLSYNKARQAAITNEILEIVGGANALKGK